MSFALHGLSVSNGVAIGHALTISAASLDVTHQFIASGSEEQEVVRLQQAFELAMQELHDLKDRLPEDAPEEMSAFLDVHRLILEDIDLRQKPEALILKRRYNAAWALTTVLDDLLLAFEEIDDPYLKERGADFRQVIERVLYALNGSSELSLAPLYQKLDRQSADAIIVAQDIAPHDMMRFKELNFCAFVTDFGGKNSHTAIVARSLDIPAAVGVKHASEIIQQDDLLISDESHRLLGGGNSRALFEYFLGYKLGLTATPKDYLKNIDTENYDDPRELERRMLLDTYTTFGCESGVPTFRYTLADGARDRCKGIGVGSTAPKQGCASVGVCRPLKAS